MLTKGKFLFATLILSILGSILGVSWFLYTQDETRTRTFRLLNRISQENLTSINLSSDYNEPEALIKDKSTVKFIEDSMFNSVRMRKFEGEVLRFSYASLVFGDVEVEKVGISFLKDPDYIIVEFPVDRISDSQSYLVHFNQPSPHLLKNAIQILIRR